MKFKVGDKVKIVMHWNMYYHKKVGTIVQAIPQRVESPGLQPAGIYKVILDGNRTPIGGWAQDDDLELVK